jgi:uncharacterized protein YggE
MRTWLLAVLLLGGPALAGTPYPDAAHVVANGEGEVSVAPDMATVTLTAQYKNANPAEAKQAVDRSINAVLGIAPQFGLARTDITASDLSLEKRWHFDDDDRRVDEGYAASREIKLKVHDLGRLNALVDAALAAGMNQIDGVDFASSRAEELRRQARAKAADDARAKARALAQEFGAALGPVYSINSVNSNLDHSYGSPTTLNKIEVTGSRIDAGQYLQPTVTYRERVGVVFELKR